MKILDISFDFETCALSPTTAVMSVAAVAWNRYGEESPFFVEDKEAPATDLLYKPSPTFCSNVDLRGMFLDGFTFDQKTADWWAERSEEAKKALIEGVDGDRECRLIADILRGMFKWALGLKGSFEADELCLWSQGSDFDIAILRNICYHYGIKIPIHHHCFRDHRTFFLEGARIICDVAGDDFDPKKAYSIVEDYKGAEAEVAHNPLYDCNRSIFSTWQMMKHLRCLNINNNANV